MDLVKKCVFAVFIMGCLSSCREKLVGTNPENTYATNFRLLWEGYDQHYSYFSHKEIDWDSLYTVFEPSLDTVNSSHQLFNLMAQLISHLEDGHASLISANNSYSYKNWYQTTFDSTLISARYLDDSLPNQAGSPFNFNTTHDIAYLRIRTFSGSKSDFTTIDEFLELQQDKKGLIVDVRGNGGGSDVNSYAVAARFAQEKTLVRKIRYRNGSQHDDFSPISDNYVSPDGMSFTKPVAVITDKSVYSAAEDFVLAMRQFPQVRTFGTFTGGGSGNPTTYNLPNGWLYKVARWQVFQPETESLYEGIGLQPDEEIEQTQAATNLFQDLAINAAIAWIRSMD